MISLKAAMLAAAMVSPMIEVEPGVQLSQDVLKVCAAKGGCSLVMQEDVENVLLEAIQQGCEMGRATCVANKS